MSFKQSEHAHGRVLPTPPQPSTLGQIHVSRREICPNKRSRPRINGSYLMKPHNGDHRDTIYRGRHRNPES